MIKTFSKSDARTLGREIEDALKPVAERHGIVVSYKGGSYTENNFTAKVEFATVANDGTAVTKEYMHFKLNARRYGLSPDDLGATFVSGGQTFTITGARPKARTKTILADNENGKTYIFRHQDVAYQLKAARALQTN